jgi:hypothetical protein
VNKSALPHRIIAAASLALFLVSTAPSQQNAPHIGFVYPAGGRLGDTLEVEVFGQFLDNVRVASISGGGIEAKVIELDKPLPATRITELRDQIQELQKKGNDAAVLREIESVREQIATSLNRNANPAISQKVRLQVELAPDAETGIRELRLRTPLGLSNPLVFCVGQLPEFYEKNPKVSADEVTSIRLPVVVNGRLIPGSFGRYRLQVRQQQSYLPGDVDRYRFTARKGQHLVAVVSARELIPYLADAVPGWLQAVLTLYDASGNEVAYNDDFRFHPDSVLYYEIPQGGEYVIEIRDALYRGREDFVYRIAIGELPFLTSIFPLGGRAGTRIKLEVSGWNLPWNNLMIDAVKKMPGIYSVTSGKKGIESNSPAYLIDNLPECFEKEPNNSAKKAQKIKQPIIVNGRIDQPGEPDVFSFKGRAGDTIVAEVYARRLESPLDSVIRLTDSKGRQLEFSDDHEDKESGLETHHADSYIYAKLPANGAYYVSLGDAQRKGGPEYGYRLRISAPQPDFELRVAPSAINALVGPNVPITVYALRKDGFSGEIVLALDGAPKGLTLTGKTVPAGQDKVQLTLTVPPALQKEPTSFILEGRANIQGHEIVKYAVPSDDMTQAFAYRHLVPAKVLKVSTTGRGPGQSALKILNDLPLKILSGGSLRVRITVPSLGLLEKIQFELIDPPEGISITESSLTGQGAEFVLQGDAAKAKPGLSGNLIVSISGERPPQAKDNPAPARRQRTLLGTLPAIPFIVAKP